jgi:hypothetical protein
MPALSQPDGHIPAQLLITADLIWRVIIADE